MFQLATHVYLEAADALRADLREQEQERGGALDDEVVEACFGPVSQRAVQS